MRLKKSSIAVKAARRRLAGLKSLTQAPNFGPNLKIEDFESEINACEQILEEYNTLNSTLDGKLTEVKAKERALNVSSRRILAAAEAQFGPDSREFEQIGGTRDSARKRPARKSTKRKAASIAGTSQKPDEQ